MFRKRRVALALGGGAARGFAHIGVIKVLEKEGIPIDVITGSSIGAFIGAGYSLWKDISLLEEKFRGYIESEDFRRSRYDYLKERDGEYGIFKHLRTLIKKGVFLGYAVTKRSFISQEEYEKSIFHLFQGAKVEDLKIPFAAIALDMLTGKEIVITKGPLEKAVWASSAIPGFLPPLQIDDYTLIDGGWIDKVPVVPAYLLGADIVIAVDVSSELHDTKGFLTGYEIMIRARAAADSFFKVLQMQFADVVIRPAVSGIHWADFAQIDVAIQEGERAARAALPKLEKLLKANPFARLITHRRKKLLFSYLESVTATGNIEKV